MHFLHLDFSYSTAEEQPCMINNPKNSVNLQETAYLACMFKHPLEK